MMKKIDLAWVAGLFEGEGCIYITPDKRIVRLSLSSVDFDVIEKLHSLVEIGHTHTVDYTVQSGPRTKMVWLSSKLTENQDLLLKLLPFLSERRTVKAEEAIAIQPNPFGRGPRVRQTECKRGHSMTPENTLESGRCRSCRNQRALERYHRTKSSTQESPELSSVKRALVIAT